MLIAEYAPKFASPVRMLPDNFIQVHRSYIVNMEKVLEIDRGRILLEADKEAPVVDVYKARLIEYVENRGVGKTKR